MVKGDLKCECRNGEKVLYEDLPTEKSFKARAVFNVPFPRLIRESRIAHNVLVASQTEYFPFLYKAQWIAGSARTWRRAVAPGTLMSADIKALDNHVLRDRLEPLVVEFFRRMMGPHFSADVKAELEEILDYIFTGPCLFEDQVFKFSGGVMSGSLLTQLLDSLATALAWIDCLPIAVTLLEKDYALRHMTLEQMFNVLALLGDDSLACLATSFPYGALLSVFLPS